MSAYNYPTVCFAVNMRHFDIERFILEKSIAFSQQGFVVLTPFKDPRQTLTPSEKDQYKRIQKDRIKMCDSLYVINPDGIMTPSIIDEIQYAQSLSKEVEYMIQPKPPSTITLIGSRKFIPDFKKMAVRLTLCGYMVNVPDIFLVSVGEDLDNLTDKDHQMLDYIYQQKILSSDQVMVINHHGYIGEDTQKEIDFAVGHNIPILYMENQEGEDIYDEN